MKILHIFKHEPDDEVKKLSAGISEGEEVSEFGLYEGNIDYGSLIDLIFEHDKVITWW
ncbi:MAG: hypothetical protein JRI41_00930 [Deltaproteobacteria bacterium]|nr:hypothetical protein [Deltaproteobacteria bacterium]